MGHKGSSLTGSCGRGSTQVLGADSVAGRLLAVVSIKRAAFVKDMTPTGSVCSWKESPIGLACFLSFYAVKDIIGTIEFFESVL